MELVQYILALIVTLGILVTIHELGHFWVARRSGVKVVRFSIGFGPSVWSRFDRHGTEFVIAAFPLGGYVRMLDDRDSDVAAGDMPYTYRRLTPQWRIAIALGGPAANFLLAIFVYTALFFVGRTDVVPIIDLVSPEAPAYGAGLRGGEELVRVDGQDTGTWQDIAMALAGRLGDSGRIEFTVRRPGDDALRDVAIPIERWHQGEDEPNLLSSLGLAPTLPAVLGEVMPDGAAAAAGLKSWDRIVTVDAKPVTSWADWVELVRASPDVALALEVERDGDRLYIDLTPGGRTGDDGAAIGFVGVTPLMREVSYGPIESVVRGVGETWSKTLLTVDLLKKMVLGLVSTKNLSGPITIAKVAGDSARSGVESFVGVLALLSISLGVLNLLPIPILDGGHVLFCLTELVIRRPVPDRIQALGVQIGLFIVSGLMVLAFYNDLTRLF